MKSDRRSKTRDIPLALTITWGAMVVAFILLYAYLLHTGEAGRLLAAGRQLGVVGAVIGVLVMAFFSVLPVPSEFISILLMQVYGVWVGTLYSWLGGLLGAIVALYLARALFRPIALRLAKRYLRFVQPWLEERGTVGLLLVRLLPMVPYHFVNYMAGVLDVPAVPFSWTTAIGILPYQVALAGVYSGVTSRSIMLLSLGGGLIVVLLGLGWVFRHRFFPDADF